MKQTSQDGCETAQSSHFLRPQSSNITKQHNTSQTHSLEQMITSGKMWLHPRLSAGLFVCKQDYAKTTRRISTKLGGRMWSGSGKSIYICNNYHTHTTHTPHIVKVLHLQRLIPLHLGIYTVLVLYCLWLFLIVSSFYLALIWIQLLHCWAEWFLGAAWLNGSGLLAAVCAPLVYSSIPQNKYRFTFQLYSTTLFSQLYVLVTSHCNTL